MPAPPTGAPYKRTRTFSPDDVPAALTRAHSTRAGVWAHVVVEAGVLTFTRIASGAVERIEAPASAWSAPEELHAVALAPETRFHIEFVRER